MASIVYSCGDNLYINLTNRCPCACVFCLRQNSDGFGSAESLWLEGEPSLEDIIKALEGWNAAEFSQVVFCGYGEPTCALPLLLRVCGHLRSLPFCPPIRLNTNGLGDLINGVQTAPLLAGLIDSVSVSLNAPTAEEYAELCRPEFGLNALPAVLKFADDCKKYIPHVCFSVVGGTISGESFELCRGIAARAGVDFRVR